MTVLASQEPLARYRDRFPIYRHATYLNSCSLGALSERTRSARDLVAEARHIVNARPGHARLSPYLYNLAEEQRGLLEILTRA